MNKTTLKSIIPVLLVLIAAILSQNYICMNSGSGLNGGPLAVRQNSLINSEGSTIEERFLVPEGFKRIEYPADSFGAYLRKLPLKPHGSPVRYYNGGIKKREVHEAVIDLDIGNRDLQQCADAAIRLRAEYLYSQGLFAKIHFNFTNGFRADYAKWAEGNRIKVEGNEARWVKQAEGSNDYASFRKYLDLVFAYAGTLSLSQETKPVLPGELETGDVFLQGGSPGHCVIVVDMAENTVTGDKIFLLAQSYMPAQDIHVLKNPEHDAGDPWYELDFGERLRTPEWEFSEEHIKRFAE